MLYLTRHTPTSAQRAAVREHCGRELDQRDITLVEETIEEQLEGLGVALFEPIAMVAPIQLVERVRWLGHPVVVLTTDTRGVPIGTDAPVVVHEFPGFWVTNWDGSRGGSLVEPIDIEPLSPLEEEEEETIRILREGRPTQ